MAKPAIRFGKALGRRSCLMVTLPRPTAAEPGIRAGDIMACARDGGRIATGVVNMGSVLEGASGPDRFTGAAREMVRPDGEGEAVAGRAGAGRPKGSKLERLRIK